jgi:serine/threonine protein phosphatase PrpC
VTALTLDCAVRSDLGRRPNNEDAVFASARMAAVADGVGGAAAGEVASRTMINALITLDKRRLRGPLDGALRDAVAWGNETISFIAACRPHTAGMSTDVDVAGALVRASPRACADALVASAVAAGARDNVSVVIADVLPRRDPAAAW